MMDYDSRHYSARQIWPKPEGKVVFLDRDGTISFENSIEEADQNLKIIPGAKEALKELKEKGFYLVLVSNQPRVGRGSLTEERLREIHEKLQDDLEIKFDCLLYCPHAEDASNPEYKLDCSWKKPKSGMLKFISKKFEVNLKKTFLIGNSEKDVMAGKEIGSTTILIGKEESEVDPDYRTHSLHGAVKLICQS